MISSKLKASLIVIIFLFLLGLDSPEFTVCSYNFPDEILDIPRVLLDGNQLRSDFHIKKLKLLKGMLKLSPPPGENLNHQPLGGKNGPFGAQGLSSLLYVAEIRKQYRRWEYSYQQNRGKEGTGLIKAMNLLAMFAEKPNKISSLLLTPGFPVLRI